MKMLVGIFALMLISFASHAQWNVRFGNVDFGHGQYEREHDNSVFWQIVEERQCSQQDRVELGLEQGQLTRREIKKLQREQRHIAKQVKHMKRHNYLTRRDKREVMEHLDYVSEKIRALSHNRHYSHRKQHHYSNKGQYVYSNNNARQYYY